MKKEILRTTLVTVGLLLSVVISANAQEGHGKKSGHKGPPSVDKIFEKMDADKDGKLAEAEVKGPLKERFTTIDVDADGFITREEMENAPKPEKPTMAE